MGSADISSVSSTSSLSSTIDNDLIKKSNNNNINNNNTNKKCCKKSSSSSSVVVLTTTIENEISTINLQTIQKDIGIGPCRFAPACTERTLIQQIDTLSMEEKMCYHNLKIKWEENLMYEPFISDDWYLRFARCSPGPTKYNEKSAWNVMIKFNRKYDKLTAEVLEEQLLTKTIFPIPELVSKDGLHEFVYIEPSRNKENNKQDASNSLKLVLYSLVYVINTMCSKSEKNCTEGIGVMFNMKNYTSKDNFSTDYITQFIKILKGAIPVRIRLCLVIDAPIWFKRLWTLLSVGFGSDFRSKTFLISSTQLSQYLQEGYEKFLPSEFIGIGMADTNEIVTDFITYRKYIEEKCLLPQYFESSKENNLLDDTKENDVYEEMFKSASFNNDSSNNYDIDVQKNMKVEQQQQQQDEDDQLTDGSTVATTIDSSCFDITFDNENSISNVSTSIDDKIDTNNENDENSNDEDYGTYNINSLFLNDDSIDEQQNEQIEQEKNNEQLEEDTDFSNNSSIVDVDEELDYYEAHGMLKV